MLQFLMQQNLKKSSVFCHSCTFSFQKRKNRLTIKAKTLFRVAKLFFPKIKQNGAANPHKTEKKKENIIISNDVIDIIFRML